MQDPENKEIALPADESVGESVTVPEISASDTAQFEKQFASLNERFDNLSKKLDVYQQAQKQLTTIVKDNFQQPQPTISWIEKEIQECNFYSDLPINPQDALDPEMSGSQSYLWYLSSVAESTQSLEEVKKSALGVMSDLMKVNRK